MTLDTRHGSSLVAALRGSGRLAVLTHQPIVHGDELLGSNATRLGGYCTRGNQGIQWHEFKLHHVLMNGSVQLWLNHMDSYGWSMDLAGPYRMAPTISSENKAGESHLCCVDIGFALMKFESKHSSHLVAKSGRHQLPCES